jgi:predicted ribosome quality control (RQC) complex YloA/Tae2 family protein
MAFDGAFLYKIVQELKTAIDCHIDKIYQPSREELVFLLRKKGFQKRLLVNVKSGFARVQFTENKYENPAVPPMFCMLLRKYLSAARLIDILQPELERVAIFIFSTTNEMGDIAEIRLVCELIGNKANAILVNNEGKIIDALRHSDVETSERLILPGAKYVLPPRPEN